MAVAKDIITNVLRTSLLRFIKDASGDQCPGRPLVDAGWSWAMAAWGMILGVGIHNLGLEDMIVVDYY